MVGDAHPPPLGACGDLGGLTVGEKRPVCCDLADIGGHREEADEDALGGDAAHPSAIGVGESLVGGVLHEAVEALDRVAVSGVGVLPLL